MRLGTPRDPALTLVLILLTCGIYYLYFIYVVSRETQEFLGEPEFSPGVEVLLSLITCGIWNIYWDYRIGKRIAQMCEQVGLPPTDNAILYLLLDVRRQPEFQQRRRIWCCHHFSQLSPQLSEQLWKYSPTVTQYPRHYYHKRRNLPQE